MNQQPTTNNRQRAQLLVPILLIAAMAVVAFWEVMSYRSARPAGITGKVEARLAGFRPAPEGWIIRPRDDMEKDHPSVENIFTYELRPEGREGIPVITRLVLGYNMPDCMRLRGYAVESIEEYGSVGVTEYGSATPTRSNAPEHSDFGSRSTTPIPPHSDTPTHVFQVWRLTSKLGERAIWATAMIRSSDYSWTGLDVRTMAFPRIVGGLDPNWVPRGFSRDGLRHPVRETRNFLLNLWNNSRCDPLTFLKLKQHAWANEDVLTLVAHSSGRSIDPDEEDTVTIEVISVLQIMQSELARSKSGE